ncbi:MAG TPA: hypothetical protein VF522_22840 [Ramlibacter sp.]|uniref:hypothetical protein n=1 Tax=Ramlibacter sp. TaxID=1917967 RepID=UPI002ED4A4C9
MHVPVVLTADPLRLARFYVHALEFELAQHIVGVFASLRSASFPLQVWGRRDARPARTRIVLEEGDAPIFDIHRHLWRVAPALLDGSSPQRTCCGAWQFRLTDIDGNQLVFMQWAGKAARAAAPRAGVD